MSATRSSSFLLSRSTTAALRPSRILSTPVSTRTAVSVTSSVSQPRHFHATARAMTVHELTRAEFNKVVNEHKVVIIDATASWCGPCKVISPVLEKLSEEPTFQSIHFCKFDVDQVGDLAMELGVRAMPSFYVYEGGEPADSMVGANPKALEALVTKYTA